MKAKTLNTLFSYLGVIFVLAGLIAAGMIPAMAQDADFGGEGTKPVQTVGIPAQAQLEADNQKSPLVDFDEASGTLTLSKSWADEHKVEKGTVVAIGATDRFPNGLMRFVEGRENDGGNAVLTTRAARLNEALAGVDAKDLAKVNGKKLSGESLGVRGTVADKGIADAVVKDNPGTTADMSGKKNTEPDILPITGNNADSTIRNRDANNDPAATLPSSSPFGIHVNKPFGKDFEFSFDRTISSSSCHDGTFDYGEYGLKLPQGTSLAKCSWKGSGSLNAHFHLKIGAKGAFVVNTKLLHIQEVSFTGGANVTGDASLESKGKLRGHMTWQLADLKFPFTIPVGPVSITINVNVKPTVTLDVDSQGNARAVIGALDASYTDVGMRFSSKGGVANNGEGGFEFLKGKPHMKATEPSLTGKVDMLSTVGINPNVSVDLMGILGVRVNVGLHANADFHIESLNPICMLGFGMHGYIGLSALNLKNIPVIGWIFGGVQNKIDEFIKKNAIYNWDVPSLYTSPNLCANKPVTIGDRVWIDMNGDGIQGKYIDKQGNSVEEPGMAGAKVFLIRGIDKRYADYDPSSAAYKKMVVATTTTDKNGHYRFTKDPAFTGVKFGPYKGQFAGKIMPGEYTVVVQPPMPSDKGYAYDSIAPYGFKSTKRFATSDNKVLKSHTLEDIQHDSGGKYLWNTNSYNAFFDGTRYQDMSPHSLSDVVDNRGDRKDSSEYAKSYWKERKAQLLGWRDEYKTTRGYNDTVDFGFVAKEAEYYRVSGKVYVADGAQDLEEGKETPEQSNSPLIPGVGIGNVRGAKFAHWVAGATVKLTPIKADTSKTFEVKTGIAGRYSASVPQGTYKVELVALPSGYKMLKGFDYTVEVSADEKHHTWGWIPGDNWVNFGVSNLPNMLSGVVFVDKNNNGKPDPGERGIDDATVDVKHLATWKAGTETNNLGMFNLPLTNTSGLISWYVHIPAPKGRHFTDNAANALGNDTCKVDSGGTGVTCWFEAKDGKIRWNYAPKDSNFGMPLMFPLAATPEDMKENNEGVPTPAEPNPVLDSKAPAKEAPKKADEESEPKTPEVSPGLGDGDAVIPAPKEVGTGVLYEAPIESASGGKTPKVEEAPSKPAATTGTSTGTGKKPEGNATQGGAAEETPAPAQPGKASGGEKPSATPSDSSGESGKNDGGKSEKKKSDNKKVVEAPLAPTSGGHPGDSAATDDKGTDEGAASQPSVRMPQPPAGPAEDTSSDNHGRPVANGSGASSSEESGKAEESAVRSGADTNANNGKAAHATSADSAPAGPTTALPQAQKSTAEKFALALTGSTTVQLLLAAMVLMAAGALMLGAKRRFKEAK